ncbi:hypothetical protein N656DRAFT_559862 [Canariomyces notabilis]|uniref:Uncharacterized protein n=1 Tax=Canariomyces notabilis TaxID=2074819 RepID=A0AAN6QBG4_9PEZI|nr:hypothetical protein N656DRAFT_559862 [Canariomyces arenarius]
MILSTCARCTILSTCARIKACFSTKHEQGADAIRGRKPMRYGVKEQNWEEGTGIETMVSISKPPRQSLRYTMIEEGGSQDPLTSDTEDVYNPFIIRSALRVQVVPQRIYHVLRCVLIPCYDSSLSTYRECIVQIHRQELQASALGQRRLLPI